MTLDEIRVAQSIASSKILRILDELTEKTSLPVQAVELDSASVSQLGFADTFRLTGVRIVFHPI